MGFSWFPAIALLFGLSTVHAQGTAASAIPIRLDAWTHSQLIESPLQNWDDPDASATIEQVVRLEPAQFRPVAASALLNTSQRNAQWLHIQLRRSPLAPAAWSLTIPVPLLDLVTLYIANDQGGWTALTAGDTVAVAAWPRPGLFPQFDLNLSGQPVHDVYLRVRNFKNINTPIRLAPTQEREQQRNSEYMGIGILAGSLLMLMVWCAIQFVSFRNIIDGWYTLYTAFMTLSVVTATGLAAEYLWPNSPVWTDLSYSVLAVLAVGSTLLCLRHLAALSTRYVFFDRFLAIFGCSAIASAVLFWLTDRITADKVSYFFFATGPLLGILTTFLAMRRKNPVGLWLLLAYVPQSLALVALVLQRFGLMPSFWEMRYYLAASIALGVPLMLHALGLHMRERRNVADRAKSLPTQDALTGLLTAPVFADQLKDVIYRSREYREHAAVVVVDIVNYELIRATYGEATAEQCLLRAAIKLYRALRDVDAAGRIGLARFGLIIEGINSRQSLSERMVKLVASGLIPLPGFKPEVTLQFHVAAVMLSEVPCDAATVLDKLGTLLSSMSGRTKRPLRFLEPAAVDATPRAADSAPGIDSAPGAAA
jgi:diguanylate cyclase (GGDEF)-like protein